MSTITPPIASIPIGYVMVQGKRVDVTTHPEFVRYFETIYRRIGGSTGTAIDGPALEALSRSMHAMPMAAGGPEPADMGYVRAFAHQPAANVDRQADIDHARAFMPRAHTSCAYDMLEIDAMLHRPQASIDPPDVVMMATMLPRMTLTQLAPDDAQNVIASKVFHRS